LLDIVQFVRNAFLGAQGFFNGVEGVLVHAANPCFALFISEGCQGIKDR